MNCYELLRAQGGKASGFKNRSGETDEYDTDGVSLLHVKGTSPEATRAVQVRALERRHACVATDDGLGVDCFLRPQHDSLQRAAVAS